MKKFLLILLILFGTLLAGFGISKIPDGIRNNQIYQNKVVKDFDAKRYQGWVFAYAALNEAEVSMYSQTPVFEDPKETENFKKLKYPK